MGLTPQTCCATAACGARVTAASSAMTAQPNIRPERCALSVLPGAAPPSRGSLGESRYATGRRPEAFPDPAHIGFGRIPSRSPCHGEPSPWSTIIPLALARCECHPRPAARRRTSNAVVTRCTYCLTGRNRSAALDCFAAEYPADLPTQYLRTGVRACLASGNHTALTWSVQTVIIGIMAILLAK